MKKRIKERGLSKSKGQVLLYKLLKIFILLLIILIFVFGILFFIERSSSSESQKGSGELGTFGVLKIDPVTGIVFPDNCSDTNLNLLWDSIFIESSSGTIKITDKNIKENCSAFVIYKTLSNNDINIIWGKNLDSGYFILREVYSIHGNLTSYAKNFINLIDKDSVNTYLTSVFFNDLLNGNYIQGQRSINTANDAYNNFSVIFDIEAGNLNNFPEYYQFSNRGNGVVYKNKTLDHIYQSFNDIKPINLTLINALPNLVLNESKMYLGVIDLDNYFLNLGYNDSNLDFQYSISNPSLLNLYESSSFNLDHKINVDTSLKKGGGAIINITLSYPGQEDSKTNNFNITLYGCVDPDGGQNSSQRSDVENLTELKTDYCLTNYTVKEYYCNQNNIKSIDIDCSEGDLCFNGACVENTSVNYAPRFIYNNCDVFIWKENTEYTFDVTDCFRDDDHDSLRYWIEEKNQTDNKNRTYSENLTFKWSGLNLTLIPDTNWVGKGYFYIFANDSRAETRGKIDFQVEETKSDGNSNISETFEIINPSPLENKVSISKIEGQIFSVGNANYDSIKWFLNNEIVKTGSKFYKISGIDEGNYNIRVEVRKGDAMDSKTWQLIVGEEIPIIIENIVSISEIIFYIMIVVIIVIILLVIWIFMAEKNKETKKKIYGFGVVEVKEKK